MGMVMRLVEVMGANMLRGVISSRKELKIPYSKIGCL